MQRAAAAIGSAEVAGGHFQRTTLADLHTRAEVAVFARQGFGSLVLLLVVPACRFLAVLIVLAVRGWWWLRCH